MILQNDLILRAASGERTERTPVWVMRQAGRVLKEYRDVRAKAGSFKNLLFNPELACEVTIQPVDIYGVDAAILFSDILVIPEAMGLEYKMDEGKGPSFDQTIRSKADLSKISTDAVEEKLEYVYQTIRLIKRDLNGRVPLIGFAGAPWTIFCYMTEGKGSKTFSVPRSMIMRDPELAHALLSAITDATIVYLKKQIAEGCDMIQLFDSWAGVLNKESYNTFALPYMKRICDEIQGVPKTVFALGAYYSLADLAQLNCNTVGLDWHMDPIWARSVVGDSRTLQGNLDPAVLYGDFETIRTKTKEMLSKFGATKHIANLGHGVYPDIDPDKLKCFIDTIKEYQHAQ
jgi:uroporphyrinogen decarboxylase